MRWSRLNPSSPESYWKKHPLPSSSILLGFLNTPITPNTLPSSNASTDKVEKNSDDLLQAIINSKNNVPVGPKVQQYMFTQTQQPQKKANLSIHQHCFICHESIRHALDGELPVPLVCGDVVHGECFELALQSTSDNNLPICKGANCLAKKNGLRIVPQDENLLELTYTRVLMNSHLNNSNRQSVHGSIYRPPRSIHLLHQTNDRTSRAISESDNSLFRLSYNRHNGKRDTHIDSVLYENDSETQRVTTDALTQFLIHTDPTIDPNFLATCGKLRLADRLLVSSDVDDETPCYCYLFERDLVILGMQPKPLLVIPLARSRCFILETLLITWLELGQEHQSEIKIGAQSSQLVEKWAIAMTDRNFVFPLVLLSSTIGTHLDYGLQDAAKSSLETRPLLELESSDFGELMSPFVEHFQVGWRASGTSFGSVTRKTGLLNTSDDDGGTILAEIDSNSGNLQPISPLAKPGEDGTDRNHTPGSLLDNYEPHHSLIGQELFTSDVANEDQGGLEVTSIYSEMEPSLLQVELASEESDSDSDAEQIDTFLQPLLEKRPWENLIDTVDQAISNIKEERRGIGAAIPIRTNI